MGNNPISLSVAETVQIANTIVKYFKLELKVIELGDNKCTLKCYENKVYDKNEILMELVWEKNCIIITLFKENINKYAIFKEEIECGENIYSIAIISSNIENHEKRFYKKEVKNGFVKYSEINEEKYIDSENKEKSNFKCKNNCIKRELF